MLFNRRSQPAGGRDVEKKSPNPSIRKGVALGMGFALAITTFTGSFVGSEATPAVAAEGDKLLFGCSPSTFDTDAEGWRVASVRNDDGVTVKDEPRVSGWADFDGLPPGALRNPDLSGSSFTEIWSPDLAAAGFDTDYAEVAGRSLSFDYRQASRRPVGEAKSTRYMGIVANDGTRYWTPFSQQLDVESYDWQHVVVEMNPTRWTNVPPIDTGPGADTNWARTVEIDPTTSPTLAQFTAALANLDRFVFAIEYTGAVFNEVALFDNFGVSCSLDVEKTSNAGANSKVGDTVNYTVKVTNTGDGDYSQNSPARLEDDLSDVLDDATYNGDAAITLSDGSTADLPIIADGKLTWSGALKREAIATITYSVTLNNEGDGSVVNNACVPGVLADASNPKKCVSTSTGLPKLSIAKSSDTTVLLGNSGKVKYQLTVRNAGPGANTALNPATFVDDMSDILDDANFVEGSLSASVGEATRNGSELTWTGVLGAEQSATIEYEVDYDANKGGDNRLINVACLPEDLAASPSARCADVEIPGAALHLRKSADPENGSTLRGGEKVTYTLNFENLGQAAATIDHDDVLADVIDDADVTALPETSSDSLKTTEIADGRFNISGELAPGESATVQYQVTVKGDGERGDDRLENFVVAAGDEPAEECTPEATNCTLHHVTALSVKKSSDPESGTEVNPGDVVKYTLTFENLSKNSDSAPFVIDYTDHMSDVLDDATLSGTPTTSIEGLTVKTVKDTIGITGEIPAGEMATVTYSVKVKPFAEQGNHTLANVLSVTGEEPVCSAEQQLCTTHKVPAPPKVPASGENPLLAVTGTNALLPTAAVAALVLLGGGLMLLRNRKKKGELALR